MNDPRWLPAFIIAFGFIFILKAAYAGYGFVKLDRFEERLRSAPQYSEQLKANPEIRAQLEAMDMRRAAMAADWSHKRPFLIADAALGVVFGIVAVICGNGLRREKRWARTVWIGASFLLLAAAGLAIVASPGHWHRFGAEAGLALASLVILVPIARRDRDLSTLRDPRGGS